MTNKLFANNVDVLNITGGTNQLSVTAGLNAIASQIASEILQVVLSDESTYESQILASQSDNSALDKLILSINDLKDVDIDFLKAADEEELEKVLKSQQSKRSRSKNQLMTVDNYGKLMTAAVAEHLVREAMGKPKSAAGGRLGTPVTYSEEQLKALAEDPDALSRAIRNVQSKKSIAKAKIDFDPESERWQQLLIAEAQLKELRAQINGIQTSKAKEAIETVETVEELVGDVDVSSLKADEAREMLAKLQEALAGKQ